MPLFIDPTGKTTYGIGICDRCKKKYSLDDLQPDGNNPGLMVCNEGCSDQFDPYKLPQRETEDITLRFVRPDIPLDGRD